MKKRFDPTKSQFYRWILSIPWIKNKNNEEYFGNQNEKDTYNEEETVEISRSLNEEIVLRNLVQVG